MPQKKEIIILPVVGKPYICNDKSADKLKDLQEIVEGYIEKVPPQFFHIHPMFINAEPRWKAVYTMLEELKNNQFTIYCNENGINEELCANMACINANPIFGVKPLMGMIFITTSRKNIEKLGLDTILPSKAFLEEEDDSDSE
jgi:hypothetical protein